MTTNKMIKTLTREEPSLERPRLFVDLFLKGYLWSAYFGARKLPKLKGVFYYIYRNIKNKKGIIKVETINKNELYIDLSDRIISGKLLQYGFWEEGLTTLVKKIIKPGMTVVDVGAHVGYYSTLFSKLVGPNGRVYSFEPDPYNNSLLRANVVLNKISNCIVEETAVSNKNGALSLHLDSENLGAHSVAELGNSGESIEVRTVSLDSYFQEKKMTKVDFMKIDIECWEDMAIEGANEIIKNNKDILIVLEFYPDGLKKINKDPKNFLHSLRLKGFNIFTIHNKTGDLTKQEDDSTLIDFCGNHLVNLFLTRNNFEKK
jgi:FkbM family methyltransferase